MLGKVLSPSIFEARLLFSSPSSGVLFGVIPVLFYLGTFHLRGGGVAVARVGKYSRTIAPLN